MVEKSKCRIFVVKRKKNINIEKINTINNINCKELYFLKIESLFVAYVIIDLLIIKELLHRLVSRNYLDRFIFHLFYNGSFDTCNK